MQEDCRLLRGLAPSCRGRHFPHLACLHDNLALRQDLASASFPSAQEEPGVPEVQDDA